MRVLLTGGAGYIGSNVLASLRDAGHSVTAVVRNANAQRAVALAGVQPLGGDIGDSRWLVEVLREHDGAIHAAAAHTRSGVASDHAFANAVATAFAGTSKPFVHTSSVWVYGSGSAIVDAAPTLLESPWAWRMGVHQYLQDRGVSVMTITPGMVYGQGRGLPNVLIAHAAVSRSGVVKLIGDGTQRWMSVHVEDLADLYLRVFTEGQPGRYYLGVAPQADTALELMRAATRTAGIDCSLRPGDEFDALARFGDELGAGLLLDQTPHPIQRGWDELAWVPAAPSLLEEITFGKYPNGPCRTVRLRGRYLSVSAIGVGCPMAAARRDVVGRHSPTPHSHATGQERTSTGPGPPAHVTQGTGQRVPRCGSDVRGPSLARASLLLPPWHRP
ncbi:hypothetical protein ABMA10_00240 [Plantibacter sp. RU18]